MTHPTYVKVTCRVNGVPTAGLIVSIVLRTKRKNDFSSLAGPSDQNGKIVVPWSKLEADAETNCNLFIMDYTGLDDFTGEIVARPLDGSHLDGVLCAHELFWEIFPYPPELPAQLMEAKVILEKLAPAVVTAEVEHDGEGIVVNAMSVEA